MKAGREMDALVAEKVMGWTVFYGEHNGYDLLDDEIADGYPPDEEAEGVPFEILNYSTEIKWAMDTLEYTKQNAKLGECTVEYIRLEWYGGEWCCRIHFTPCDDEIVWAEDESLPLAICKACLLAMGVSEV